MTRKAITKKINAKIETIKKLRAEIVELNKQSILLSDRHQQYFEEEMDVVVKRRPKTVERQLRGYITWKEKFKDEDTGKYITLQRYCLVRINGEWI